MFVIIVFTLLLCLGQYCHSVRYEVRLGFWKYMSKIVMTLAKKVSYLYRKCIVY